MGIERVGVEDDIRLRFYRRNHALLKRDRLRHRMRNALRFRGPVVSVIRDAHHDFVRRNQLQHVLDVANEPILGSDGPGEDVGQWKS